MTRIRKTIAISSWILAALGGGWAVLTMLSAYMTTTGLLHSDDLRIALPLPVLAIIIALAVHLWPRPAGSPNPWPWCLPVYFVAGGPLFLLVATWLDQH